MCGCRAYTQTSPTRAHLKLPHPMAPAWQAQLPSAPWPWWVLARGPAADRGAQRDAAFAQSFHVATRDVI